MNGFIQDDEVAPVHSAPNIEVPAPDKINRTKQKTENGTFFMSDYFSIFGVEGCPGYFTELSTTIWLNYVVSKGYEQRDDSRSCFGRGLIHGFMMDSLRHSLPHEQLQNNPS